MIDSNKPVVQGNKALEIAMRDVLDGMEEAALYVGFEGKPGVMEIISIESPSVAYQSSPRATVTRLNSKSARVTVSDYLIRREKSQRRA